MLLLFLLFLVVFMRILVGYYVFIRSFGKCVGLFLGAAAPWTPRLFVLATRRFSRPPGETKTWPGSGPRSGIAERTALGP